MLRCFTLGLRKWLPEIAASTLDLETHQIPRLIVKSSNSKSIVPHHHITTSPYLLIGFVNSTKAPVDLTDLTIIDTPAIHLPYAILLTIGNMVPIGRDTMDGVKAPLRISFPALRCYDHNDTLGP